MVKVKSSKTNEAHKVPKEKIELVKKITKLIDENNTVMFASIKSLPSKQFQKIKKSISNEVKVIVPKKSLLNRAIDNSKKNEIKNLKDYIKEDIAVLITQTEAFDLSSTLSDNQTPVKARAGQIAEEDIEVEPGPTELTAGPVVSELGSLGIKIEIKAGKIDIKEPKVIVKKGQSISEAAVSIMGKLNITPFSVGFIPVVAYDSKSGKIYSSLIIDKKGTLESIKNKFSRSMAFAVSIAYPTQETLKFIFAKAASHESALAKLISQELKSDSINTSEENNQINSEITE
ncbi:MAG TPA: 50S ribosomal protein L10 [Candidatus Nanoarchaeia archaeon]|nr:50S ribosomal protein L10 [Candidatus Nanoarchaeia archaeon]